MVKCLIALRDGKTKTLDDLINALQDELKLVDRQKNNLNPCDINYSCHQDYLDEIKYGLQSSYDEVINWNINQINLTT